LDLSDPKSLSKISLKEILGQFFSLHFKNFHHIKILNEDVYLGNPEGFSILFGHFSIL